MSVFVRRRPEMAFLISLIFLGVVLFVRAVASKTPDSVVAQLTAPLPATTELSETQTQISVMQNRLRANPADTAAYAQLGLALLQQVRETADPSAYQQAAQALDEAIKRDPKNLDALLGQGALALARHDFAAALAWGEQAKAVNPHRGQVYGVIADAQIELGQYAAAEATLQTMITTRPDLGSYSRISYFRELHGETAGAIEAMQLAVESGSPTGENTAWTRVQLGHLYFNQGDLDSAEREYRQALVGLPNFVHAEAALARLAAARGDWASARSGYAIVANQLPLPEYVIAAGELELAAGDEPAAQQHFALVAAIDQLYQANGSVTDLEMALFLADHGDAQEAVRRARTAYAQRPSIKGAEVLAWALSQAGQHSEAQTLIVQAMRLGTKDASLWYHAGMIAQRNGDIAQAKTLLQAALDLNPYFSPLYAERARQMLAQLR